MNDTATSASGASLLPDTTDIFTAAHLALVAVLALLVIAGLIFGARLARRRRLAERELAEHNREIAHEKTTPPARTVEPPVAVPAEVVAARPEPRRDEPIAIAPTLAEAPAAAAAPPALAEAAASLADAPVTQLKGLGPKVADRLAEQGITTIGQIAALTDDQATALDARLGPFTGRMGRDRWQEQARFLAAGDRAGFEAVFGKL